LSKNSGNHIQISNQSDPAQEKNSHNHSGYSEKSSKEVKAELQEYLSSMKINSILNSMVEKLLQEKPAQPHSFAVIYLCETYPNRVRHALDKITPIVLLKRLNFNIINIILIIYFY
jgi:hypothetical protein